MNPIMDNLKNKILGFILYFKIYRFYNRIHIQIDIFSCFQIIQLCYTKLFYILLSI